MREASSQDPGMSIAENTSRDDATTSRDDAVIAPTQSEENRTTSSQKSDISGADNFFRPPFWTIICRVCINRHCLPLTSGFGTSVLVLPKWTLLLSWFQSCQRWCGWKVGVTQKKYGCCKIWPLSLYLSFPEESLNDKCIICLTRPKNASIIHGYLGHQVSDYTRGIVSVKAFEWVRFSLLD